MNTFAKSIAFAAILVSAAAPALAEERVTVGDLRLSTAAGAATLDHRIDVAARRFCVAQGLAGLDAIGGCRADVRAEVLGKLSSAQREQLVAAATSHLTVATR